MRTCFFRVKDDKNKANLLCDGNPHYEKMYWNWRMDATGSKWLAACGFPEAGLDWEVPLTVDAINNTGKYIVKSYATVSTGIK